jgi:putative hydrolase of the HAD superfamily
MCFSIIAFDADDTLWHNETLYKNVEAKFRRLLSDYQSPDWIDQRLFETESRNIQHFGYGIKSFALSMIETAIELTEGRILAIEIKQIIDWAKEMLQAEIHLLDGVVDVLEALCKSYGLMVITKGDLLDQQAKIDHSGLRKYFKYVEIVNNKNKDTYLSILQRLQIDPQKFMMVGNSLRSDILPVMEIGGVAVYIPYHLTWAHENEYEGDLNLPGCYELENIMQLPNFIETLKNVNHNHV